MSLNAQAASVALDAIKCDPRLSNVEKRYRMAPIVSAMRSEFEKVRAERDDLKRQMARNERFVEALEDVDRAWPVRWKTEDFEDRELKVEKNDVSRLHKLADAIKVGDVFFDGEDEGKTLEPMPDGVVPFVITTDWNSIIGKQEGEFILPFERCSFEYRMSGRSVIIVCAQEEGQTPRGSAFVEAKNGCWIALGDYGKCDWINHVRAACIVLDAEVAEQEVIRAPHALNAKRQKAGKAPLVDFRVVNLKERHRHKRGESNQTGAKRRLHFCRGHWRHLEQRKTWIRWCIKGDASLGIVVKDYSL